MKNNKNKIFIFLTILSLFSFSFFINPTETKAECKIDSATFTEPGTKNDDWFVDGKNAPAVTVKVTATDCIGKTVEVSITEDDVVTNDDDVDDLNMENIKVKFTESNSFSMNYFAGETQCELEGEKDCNYFISVYEADGGDFESNGKSGGNLNYDCDGACDENWRFTGVTLTPPVSQELGDCTITVSEGPPQVLQNKTKKECADLNGIWGRKPEDKTYHFLAPLPGLEEPFDPTQPGNLGTYLNIMINLFIGICAVLAVIMIVMGGLEYMTSELISSKEHGKERINSAIFGLILALGAWTILYTINPDLLNTELSSLKNVEVVIDLGGEGNTPLNETTIQNDLKGVGIICPKDGGAGALAGIAQSYIGNSTYSQKKRNTTSGGIAYVDCSSYVSQVYVCAGLRNPGGTSLGIFGSGKGTPVTSISTDGTTINGVALKIGDLIGWTAGGKEESGHVMMYIGGGKMIDAQGQGGVATRSVSSYITRIKFVKKL